MSQVEALAVLPMAALDKLLAEAVRDGKTRLADDVRAAQQRGGAHQTAELENCGRLFHHHEVQRDSFGAPIRTVTKFTGDPGAWMQPYMTGPAVGFIDSAMCTGANAEGALRSQTVLLAPGETVRIERAA